LSQEHRADKTLTSVPVIVFPTANYRAGFHKRAIYEPKTDVVGFLFF
jgi:hypothetical protein